MEIVLGSVQGEITTNIGREVTASVVEQRPFKFFEISQRKLIDQLFLNSKVVLVPSGKYNKRT